jgi:hypothetical protein
MEGLSIIDRAIIANAYLSKPEVCRVVEAKRCMVGGPNDRRWDVQELDAGYCLDAVTEIAAGSVRYGIAGWPSEVTIVR